MRFKNKISAIFFGHIFINDTNIEIDACSIVMSDGAQIRSTSRSAPALLRGLNGISIQAGARLTVRRNVSLDFVLDTDAAEPTMDGKVSPAPTLTRVAPSPLCP